MVRVLRGLSTGDFKEGLAALLGDEVEIIDVGKRGRAVVGVVVLVVRVT